MSHGDTWVKSDGNRCGANVLDAGDRVGSSYGAERRRESGLLREPMQGDCVRLALSE
jgi:hypothetical protein